MSSWFDSQVYSRRRETEWARVSMLAFMKDVVWNDNDVPHQNKVILSVMHRPDVASRLWFELEWTGMDEKRHVVSSQDFDLLMWRAAQTEINVQRKLEDQEKGLRFVVSTMGARAEGDPEFERKNEAIMYAITNSKNKLLELWNKNTGSTIMLVRDEQTFLAVGSE